MYRMYQDQYAALTQQGQQATQAFVDAWIQSVQDTSIRVPSVTAQAAAQQVVDQVCDLAVSVIDVQRKFGKQFVTSSASIAEDVARRATTAANQAGTVRR
jgi:hypothetical protein